MKMAKASEADINMAMMLTGYLEAIERGWVPSDLAIDDDGCEWIDTDDAAQYDRLIEGLRTLLQRGSIGRVVWGLATICDPANKLLDPDADTLEIHPELARAAEQRDELLAALELIATVNATVREYQVWARAAISRAKVGAA